jgi:hypothetical protein
LRTSLREATTDQGIPTHNLAPPPNCQVCSAFCPDAPPHNDSLNTLYTDISVTDILRDWWETVKRFPARPDVRGILHRADVALHLLQHSSLARLSRLPALQSDPYTAEHTYHRQTAWQKTAAPSWTHMLVWVCLAMPSPTE